MPASAEGPGTGVPGPSVRGYLPDAFGFLTFGGIVLTWASARSTHCAANSGVARQAPGRLVYPPIGRSAGPNGPDPSMPSSSARAASSSRTPTAGPNNPANMFPRTNAPRLPNIGLTSTDGSSGSPDWKKSCDASLGFGISMVAPLQPGPGSGWAGADWKTLNAAPCGSAATAILPIGVSNGPARTEPPSSLIFAAAASASATL